MCPQIPPGLLDVLQSPDILKLGVNIRGDALKLRRDFPHVRMRGFLDISHCARKVDALAMGPGRAVRHVFSFSHAGEKWPLIRPLLLRSCRWRP